MRAYEIIKMRLKTRHTPADRLFNRYQSNPEFVKGVVDFYKTVEKIISDSRTKPTPLMPPEDWDIIEVR